MIEPFAETSVQPAVRGFLHRPSQATRDGLVITHGAGANCQAPLLVALADAFAGHGIAVLRCDLPFRQTRSHGPPRPGDAKQDREGIKNALAALRGVFPGRIFLGGHSYGGRQATMLCASEPGLADGLLLLSYPLHPPRKPEQLRTQHFPELRTPALFVHGVRDSFGSIDEMEEALRLIPARHAILSMERASHDLGFTAKAKREELVTEVIAAFDRMFG